MTTITIDRATVEQALKAMRCAVPTGTITLYEWDKAMAELDAALAQQAEPHRDLRAALQAPGCERLREWVEIGPVQRAALETFAAALAQQAEPTGKKSLQVESVVAENATTQQQIEDTPPSDYRRGYWDGFRIGKREGRIEAEDKLAQQAEPVEPVAWAFRHSDGTYHDPSVTEHSAGMVPLYPPPPQRLPLPNHDQHCVDVPGYGLMAVRLVRAVERAHGIGGNNG